MIDKKHIKYITVIDKKHIHYIITKLSFTCLAIAVVMPLITTDTLKVTYFTHFHSNASLGYFLEKL